MAKTFDPVLKDLADRFAADWVEALRGVLGLPPGPVRVTDSDLSAMVAQADKVFRLGGPATDLLHLELQSGWEADLDGRTLKYNVLLGDRHRLPVRSAIVLLRPEANASALTGLLRRARPDGTVYLEFRYDVIRLWQLPVDQLLAGPIGALPLAPLADVTAEALPGVVQRIDERFRQELPPERLGDMRSATEVLMGLRWPDELIRQIFEGVGAMRESVVYQRILKEGRAEEAQRVVLELGRQRFGEPPETVRVVLEGISDLDRLERMIGRILQVASWE